MPSFCTARELSGEICNSKIQLNVEGEFQSYMTESKQTKFNFLEKTTKDDFKETILDSVLFVPMLSGKIQDKWSILQFLIFCISHIRGLNSME